MSLVNHETGKRAPEVPLQVITPADVKASVRRAKRNLEAAAEEIVWQIEREAWRTLGYSSWTAMREAEYGGTAFMVPGKSRPELVERIRAKGLTQQEIADTAGVSEATVRNDLNRSFADEDRPAPPTITNSRGQQRPPSYTRTEPDDDVVDAEIVEDDDELAHVNRDTGEITDPNTEEAGPVAPDPAPQTVTCPTCGGTGEVTR